MTTKRTESVTFEIGHSYARVQNGDVKVLLRGPSRLPGTINQMDLWTLGELEALIVTATALRDSVKQELGK